MGAKPWLVGAVVVAGGVWFVLRSDDPVPPASVVESRAGVDARCEAGRALPLERRELVAEGPEATSPSTNAPAGAWIELSGRILSRVDRTPIAGALVTVWQTQYVSDASGGYEALFPWRSEMTVVQAIAAGFESAWARGVPVWMASPGLSYQMPEFDMKGRATVPGLAPGRYRLRAIPDDLVFEPATFVVGAEGADVELRWRRR